MKQHSARLVARARSREVTAVLAVALLLLIVVALLLGGTTPAHAEGLDFGCREGTPAELGLAARLEKEYPKFKAELPDPELPIGVRPEPTLLTVEVTGTDDQGAPWPFISPDGEDTTTYSDVIAATKGGIYPTPLTLADFYDVDLNGDGVADFSFARRLRGASHGTRLDPLLSENFAVAPDATVPINGVDVPTHSLAGFDFIVFKQPGGMLDTVTGGLAVTLGLSLPNDNNSRTNIETTIDDLEGPDGNEWPDASQFTVAVHGASANAWPNDGFIMAAIDHSWFDDQGAPIPDASRPVIRDGIEIVSAEIEDEGEVETSVMDVELGFSVAPRPFAGGLYSICDPMHAEDSRTQISWNTEPATNLASTTFDAHVVTGEGQGILGNDEVVVDASLEGLPARSDWTFRPEVLHVARSTDVVPDLTLHELQIARGGDDDQPIRIVDSAIESLPEHSYLTATYETVLAERRLASIGLEFCPQDAAVLPADEPLVPCAGGAPLAPTLVQIDARDFFDGADTEGIPLDEPAGADPYVVYGSRDHGSCVACPSQFRVAARLFDVARVHVDLTHDEGFLKENGIDVDAVLGSAQPLDVVLHFDTGDSTGKGAETDITASLTEIPAGAVTVSQHDDLLHPLMLRTALAGPVDAIDATFTSRKVGGEKREIRGHASASPVPQELQVDWVSTAPPDATFNRVTYSASHATDVVFDAEVTTEESRETNARHVVSGNAHVPGGGPSGPSHVSAEWTETLDNGELKLDEIEVQGCAPADKQVCDNALDVVVRHDDDYDEDATPAEILPAVLPTIPDDALGDDGRHPEFTEWPAGEGVRAVLRPDADWGVHASVHNVRSARYRSDPAIFELATDPTGHAFVINVYDDRYAELDHVEDVALADEQNTTSREMFIDATISSLPKFVGARYEAGHGNEPIRVWFTTDPARQGDLDFDSQTIEGGYPEEEPGPEILQGVVRVGDRQSLRDQWQGDWMTRTRNTSDIAGIDAQLWARGRDRVTLSGSDIIIDTPRYALDLWANEPVPRNLFVEIPPDESCAPSEGAVAYANCQTAPIFEPEVTHSFGGELITSSPDLGRLWFEGGFGELVGERVTNPCSAGTTGLHKPKHLVRASADRIPSELDLEVGYENNARLPWRVADVDLEAAEVIPLFTVDVETPEEPAFYRVGEDIESDASYVRTERYKVRLANIPTTLHLDGRIARPDIPHRPDDLTQRPEACPQPNGLAYVHADVNLMSTATNVAVDAHVRADDRSVVTLTARDGPDEDAQPVAIWGELRLRQDGVGAQEHIVSGRSEFMEGVAAVMTGLLSLIFGDFQATFDAQLDADVPIRLAFQDTADVRFGNHLTTFGVDLSDTLEAGAQFEVRQLSMTDEFPDFTVDQDGVFYHRQDVVLDGPSHQFRSEHRTNAFADVGLYRWSECAESKGWKDDKVCYWNHGATSLNATDVTLHGNSTSEARTDPGLATYDLILDPFFQAGSREDMYDRWDTCGGCTSEFRHAGSLFYDGLADHATPVRDADFDQPEIDDHDIEVGDITVAGYDHWANLFPPIFPNDDDCWEVDASGADGTRYQVRGYCDEDGGKDGIVLAAYFAGGDDIARWTIKLPDPVGYGGNGDSFTCIAESCELDVDLDPQPTGEVEVRIRTIGDGDSAQEQQVGGYVARYDPSGNPGLALGTDGEATGVVAAWGDGPIALPAAPEVIFGTTNHPVELAPACANPASWWCNAPAAGVRRSWFTGDGARVEVPADGSVVAHGYGLTGTYRSVLVEYGDTGAVLRQQWFTMTIV